VEEAVQAAMASQKEQLLMSVTASVSQSMQTHIDSALTKQMEVVHSESLQSSSSMLSSLQTQIQRQLASSNPSLNLPEREADLL